MVLSPSSTSHQPSADLTLASSHINALAAVTADTVDSRFLVGSCDISSNNNTIALVRWDAPIHQLAQDAVFSHPEPIHSICTSPTDVGTLITITDGDSDAKVYKADKEVMQRVIGDDDDAIDETPLTLVSTLSPPQSASPMVDLVWRNSNMDEASSDDAVLSLNRNGTVTRWNMETGQATKSETLDPPTSVPPHPVVRWDPHTPAAVAVCMNQQSTGVQFWDWRLDTSIPTGTVTRLFHNAQSTQILDIDYNPNKPYLVATAGSDGSLAVWDIRSTSSSSPMTSSNPLLTVTGAHSHWTWSVQYNPFHDQLLLSTSTDRSARLWRLSTVSSAPVEDTANGAVTLPHTGTLYRAAWSAADAWVYATIGYGRLTAHVVPSTEKYKILL